MKSVWFDSCTFHRRVPLEKDINTEVLIIGAGIAGILTAYMLKENGKKVIVIDSNRIAEGNTKNTTAKITSQHGLIYYKLISEFGKELAKQYAIANENAIKKYKEIIKDKKIDCELEERAAYIYSLNDIEDIIQEVESANRLGISAEFVEEIDIPIKVKGAIKFNNQAQFNPLKFLKAISDDIEIYEDTKAIDINENLVFTNRGKITAKYIVITTHYPIINIPGYYFLKMHQERSYVLALENASNIGGMYLDKEKDGYSFRDYGELLLLGAMDKRIGENDEGGCYDKIRNFAKELYPNSIEKYHWSAQDCMTIDGIPYIGKYSEKTPNMYVATGFNKWGMTSSMVSAMIISDMILDRKNDFSTIFSPHRFDLTASIKNVAKDIGETAKNFIAQKLYIPSETIDSIKNGHGGVVEYKGEKVGVYKNQDGKAFVVSTKCTHLGCQLGWNPDELTWECPCHGSRFNYQGKAIDSPTIKDLQEYEVISK